MEVTIKDRDLRKIYELVEGAQLELNKQADQYLSEVQGLNLGSKPLGKSAPSYIEGPHRAKLGEIKKKYAEKIMTICSRMLK